MSAIADRSGTGKPTIHLRWPGRREVMLAAVEDVGAPPAEPSAANARDALLEAVLDDRELLSRRARAPRRP